MADLSVGSVFAGCRIEAVAGRGGMGVVFKATQVALDRPVALKAIAPDVALEPMFQERFKHEARLTASIDHPNVVPVYEAGDIDGQLYLVMRWVDGVDLRARIDRGPPLDPKQAARIAGQVGSALGAAHAKGLMHRDVKPANVLLASVDDGDHAYLTDFGIARLEHATSGLTHTGTVVGTIDYMAPERIEGGTGDTRSDIYSLGCMLYEMLTGRPPYVRENDGARLYAHMSAPIPSASDARREVPPALSEVAHRAMAKQPEDRFQTAGEMARAALVAVDTGVAPTIQRDAPGRTVAAETRVADPAAAATKPVADASPTRPAPPSPPAGGVTGAGRRRPRALLVAGAVLAVGAVVAAIALLAGGDDDAPELAAGEPIPIAGSPDGLAAGDGRVWTAGAESEVVVRIDAASGEVIGEPIPVGRDPDSVAIGEDAVWVTNNDSQSVSRIDPDSGDVVEEIRVGRNPEGIAIDDAGAPWVALLGEDGVRRIDPDSNTADPIVATGTNPHDALVDGETVWVANTADGSVSHFDRGGGEVSTVDIGGSPRAFAHDESALWVVDAAGRVAELDPDSGALRSEIEMQGNPREIAVGHGALWVTLNDTNQLARVDLASREVTTRPAPQGPVGVDVEGGFVWVASHGASAVTPFEP